MSSSYGSSSRLLFSPVGRCCAVPILTVVLVLVGCHEKAAQVPPRALQKSPPLIPAKLEIEPFVMPRVVNPGYVGPQTCSECHADRVEECLSSSHFRTCRIPNAKTMPRGFSPGNNTFELPSSGVQFEMTEQDGRFFQTAKSTSSSSQLATQSSIDLIVGAGKSSDEVYLSWHSDNTMWELPVAWVYANDCWGASGFDRDSGGDRARALTVRCFECHNTWFEHVPGTIAEYRREELILGVTCERCHGPGKEHVEFHRSYPAEKESHQILLPSSLPRERLIEVCTQCHGNSILHRGPALTYRPGKTLDDFYKTVDPAYQEDDHVANQIEYLRQSKCFSRSEMTCITCHDPHRTDQPAEGTSFQSNCSGCHQPEHCDKRFELPVAVQDKCVECHMRKYVKINVNFDLADDSYVPPARRSQHRIEVDDVATQEVLLAWHRSQTTDEDAQRATVIEEQLVNDWLSEADKCIAQERYRGAIAAIREALIVRPTSEVARSRLREYITVQTKLDADFRLAERLSASNRDAEARDAFTKVLEVQPNNADALGRLGKVTAKLGDRLKANALLAKANELEPDDQYGWSMLAWFAMLDKDYPRAAELYRQADLLEPFNSKIQSLWGEALARAGNFPEAIAHYRESLRINPRQTDALRGLIIAYSETNQFASAIVPAKQLVQLTNYQDVGNLMTLADLHLKLGQDEDVRKLVAHALELSRKSAPQFEAVIREWVRANEIEL